MHECSTKKEEAAKELKKEEASSVASWGDPKLDFKEEEKTPHPTAMLPSETFRAPHESECAVAPFPGLVHIGVFTFVSHICATSYRLARHLRDSAFELPPAGVAAPSQQERIRSSDLVGRGRDPDEGLMA